MRRAVIDVGTNSVKLLVADVAAGIVDPYSEESEQTRLGEGFYGSHRLQSAAIERTAQAIARLARQAQSSGTESLRVIATSAVRDAINREDFLAAVRKAAGLEIEVISGEQEAELAFMGVQTDSTLRAKPLLLVDLGGGSMELIVGHDTRQHYRQSFALGTVRLLERFRPSDPPSETERDNCREWLSRFFREQVAPPLAPWLHRLGDHALLVGTGGTSSILSAMEARIAYFDRAQIERTTLSLPQIKELHKRLWTLPLQERRQLPGLPANRADVILFGVAVFRELMETLGFSEMRVSTRGLRFAAVLPSGAGRAS